MPGASWPVPPSFACCSASGPVKAAILALPSDSWGRGRGRENISRRTQLGALPPPSPQPVPGCVTVVSLDIDPGCWVVSSSCAQHQGKTVCREERSHGEIRTSETLPSEGLLFLILTALLQRASCPNAPSTTWSLSPAVTNI